jgi:intracellular sulfur oxidation DsrE/DsrF family protein
MAFLRGLLLLVVMTISCAPTLHAATPPDDHEALAGLKTAQVIFDVRVAELEKLVFNLRLFKETREGISAQGVKPEMVVAFRGPTVKLLIASGLDNEARDLLRELKKSGVKFEACAVAMHLLKVDQAELVPEVKLVANVFSSLIGYQNKGYALIVIQ